jgi:hypothetical protein
MKLLSVTKRFSLHLEWARRGEIHMRTSAPSALSVHCLCTCSAHATACNTITDNLFQRASSVSSRWLQAASVPGHALEANIHSCWRIHSTIARTLLEDICDKPIVIQSYCAVVRLHGLRGTETDDLLREIEWINCYIYFNFCSYVRLYFMSII